MYVCVQRHTCVCVYIVITSTFQETEVHRSQELQQCWDLNTTSLAPKTFNRYTPIS